MVVAVVLGAAGLCEHLCDCDLVIWKTFKGATAGLVSPPCISMFAFVFAAVVCRPGEGGLRGGNSQHARSVASPRRREKRKKERKKKGRGEKKTKATAKADFIRSPLLSIQTNWTP